MILDRDQVPPQIGDLRCWVLWKRELRKGKMTKVPYRVVNPEMEAKSNDSSTWATLDEALAALPSSPCDGIGVMLGDGLGGVELDAALDEHGDLVTWSHLKIQPQDVLDAMPATYTEVSPSGRGLHQLVFGEALAKGVKVGDHDRGEIAVYTSGRFFTFTGRRWHDSPLALAQSNGVLRALAARLRPASVGQDEPQPEPASSTESVRFGVPVPQLLLEPLLSDPGFWGVWERTVKMPTDQTASAYCQSLANRAVAEGLSDQIGVSLQQAWREKHGEQPKPLKWYLDNMKEARTSRIKQAASSSSESESSTPPTRRWPVLHELALHGQLGELVRIIEPHSESDPVALLVQSLIVFGSVVGRHAYWMAEGDRHHTNMYATLVGETSKGRKGTSLGRVRSVFAQVDSDWDRLCVANGGLSSGEGLIYQVRDPSERKVKGKVEVDHGVIDKRFLVAEGELSTMFKVMQRDGNTLSPVVRNAWDHGNLRPMTKTSPIRATDAHISIVGHITMDELLRTLSETEAANGFANRFLWLLVRRSKCLPDGGALHPDELVGVTQALKKAVEHATKSQLMRRDEEAREKWAEIYPRLSEGGVGLLGAITNRAEAQVMRLAMLYALTDCDNYVRVPHLAAAVALWEYCAASCSYIFGDSLGDETADEILRALGAAPNGTMTRTEISFHFARHKTSQVAQALLSLEKQRLIVRGTVPTGGRSAETWTLRSHNSLNSPTR